MRDRAVAGLKSYLGIFVYIFLVLMVFRIHEFIVLRQHHVGLTHLGLAIVNAYVLAKVMLVAEELRLGGAFEDYPLIYPILAKSLLFAIVLIAFRIIETLVLGYWHGRTMEEGVAELGGGGLTSVIAYGVIVTVALMPFFALRAIAQLVGGPELRTLMFLRGSKDLMVKVTLRPPDSRGGPSRHPDP